MGQYQPRYQVGQIGRDGKLRYEAINRRPSSVEMATAFAAARSAELRLDARS
jgi:hypothetical protein